MLKNHAAFSRFSSDYSRVPAFTYDVCFNSWPLEADQYSTSDFKHWYDQAELALGDQNKLFAFWCNENQTAVETFVEQFIAKFNLLAERNEADALPPTIANPNE